MNAKLLYLSEPIPTAEPAIQVNNGGKVIITSIRIANPSNKNGYYSIYHLWRSQTATATSNAIAYQIATTSKTASEFLTHPLPLSPGESLWLEGDATTIAIYGIVI
jgi:hypothetical protein